VGRDRDGANNSDDGFISGPNPGDQVRCSCPDWWWDDDFEALGDGGSATPANTDDVNDVSPRTSMKR
jgi:hypothetical protein